MGKRGVPEAWGVIYGQKKALNPFERLFKNATGSSWMGSRKSERGKVFHVLEPVPTPREELDAEMLDVFGIDTDDVETILRSTSQVKGNSLEISFGTLSSKRKKSILRLYPCGRTENLLSRVCLESSTGSPFELTGDVQCSTVEDRHGGKSLYFQSHQEGMIKELIISPEVILTREFSET